MHGLSSAATPRGGRSLLDRSSDPARAAAPGGHCADVLGHACAFLTGRPTPGRPRQLTALQESRLVRDLMGGALGYGYATDLWTSRRIAEMIDRRFGVRYHRAHISRLLAQNDWDARAHECRARARDEAAMERRNRNFGCPIHIFSALRGNAPPRYSVRPCQRRIP